MFVFVMYVMRALYAWYARYDIYVLYVPYVRLMGGAFEVCAIVFVRRVLNFYFQAHTIIAELVSAH